MGKDDDERLTRGDAACRPNHAFKEAEAVLNELGKLLFITGLILAGVGLLMWSGIGRGWLGRMPGDVSEEPG